MKSLFARGSLARSLLAILLSPVLAPQTTAAPVAGLPDTGKMNVLFMAR